MRSVVERRVIERMVLTSWNTRELAGCGDALLSSLRRDYQGTTPNLVQLRAGGYHA
jgi:hypothetical protein